MHRFTLAIAAACALSACAPMDTKDKGVAKCDTSKLDWAKGQPATEDNARRLVRESGLGLWRIIGPENVERADYRPDRLTIYTDKDNVIQSLDCH
ncbi:Inhibitor I78 domain containing protein [Lysobacter dokdonensis DS-58]|uniref:Inhibitor I78 domain containing protein n=1 Tax=Lysobacter dokdonensis DS-58 TaxID=1300345 RepID=A0A0A2X0K2_9GAMM|nr:I78 family peptidase inhibitor [Lysobacter dokdonensis]KGQ18739.1 Inhibitor I78 domain containing protein [Lysobacter dokdonensis DS-58]